MNKPRRKELQKALDMINDARDIIEAMKYEEQDAYDNLPEGIQDSERGEQMDENISDLEEVMDGLEEQASMLEDILCR